MKALFVVDAPLFGGPANEALRLAAPLAAHDVEVSVLVPEEPGDAASVLAAAGVPAFRLPTHRLRARLDLRLQARWATSLRRDVRLARGLMRLLRPDVVVMTALSTTPQTAIAARAEGVPVVWKVVDTSTPALVRWGLLRLVKRLAGAVMFAGQAVADLHLHQVALGVPAFVYVPGVDTAVFRPDPEAHAAVRRRLGVGADDLLVGTVANLNPLKGVEFFVRAAGRLADEFPSATFAVLGSAHETHPAYRVSVEREIASLGPNAGRVRLLGGTTQVAEHLAAMDVKVIASRSEGTPNTAIEAMSCGVPVVATDVGAVREVVLDEQTGLVVPPEDTAALAGAVGRLLGDEPLRRRMGEAGRRHALENLSVELSAEQHLQAFRAATTLVGRGRAENAQAGRGSARKGQ